MVRRDALYAESTSMMDPVPCCANDLCAKSSLAAHLARRPASPSTADPASAAPLFPISCGNGTPSSPSKSSSMLWYDGSYGGFPILGYGVASTEASPMPRYAAAAVMDSSMCGSDLIRLSPIQIRRRLIDVTSMAESTFNIYTTCWDAAGGGSQTSPTMLFE